MSKAKQYTSIGGQAVIEGVMMRSPHFLAVAVRKPDGKILVKFSPWKSIQERFSFLKKPFIRGVVGLIESMVYGIETLTYSANIAAKYDPNLKDKTKEQELTPFAIISSLVIAFAFGMLIFVAAPHLITAFFGKLGFYSGGVDNPVFHLIDGLIKVIFLVSYVYGISLMKDVYRVFQYHGAEHKSIYAFEQGEELKVENAKKYTTLHPRCGTSFLLFLLIISIIIFSVVLPLFHLTKVSSIPILNHVFLILIKIMLMFPVAGISYEFIKLSAKNMENPIFKVLILPGLLLQKITTREPDESQLEVAIVALKKVLELEKETNGDSTKIKETEIEVSGAHEIQSVSASVSEFVEA